MSAIDDLRNDDTPHKSADGPDPELIELPRPRRPFRRLALATLASTVLVAASLICGLYGDLRYTLSGRPVAELGELSALNLAAGQRNTWVRGDGEVEPIGGIRYERPLESDSFRLARLRGHSSLWVQIRVPRGYENEYFVAPTTFSGRLVPIHSLGLRYSTLAAAPEDAGWESGHLPASAWVLIDGETPANIRWVVGLVGLFGSFALFSLWALYSLLRPAPGMVRQTPA